MIRKISDVVSIVFKYAQTTYHPLSPVPCPFYILNIEKHRQTAQILWEGVL